MQGALSGLPRTAPRCPGGDRWGRWTRDSAVVSNFLTVGSAPWAGRGSTNHSTDPGWRAKTELEGTRSQRAFPPLPSFPPRLAPLLRRLQTAPQGGPDDDVSLPSNKWSHDPLRPRIDFTTPIRVANTVFDNIDGIDGRETTNDFNTAADHENITLADHPPSSITTLRLAVCHHQIWTEGPQRLAPWRFSPWACISPTMSPAHQRQRSWSGCSWPREDCYSATILGKKRTFDAMGRDDGFAYLGHGIKDGWREGMGEKNGRRKGPYR